MFLIFVGSRAEEVSAQDVSEEIAEEIIEDVSEVSDDKTGGIEINLKQKGKEDMYDVTVSYPDDFTADDLITDGSTLHDKIPVSPRSEVTEAEPKTVPLSARSATEISEHISEPVGSISEGLIKPLDLEKNEDIEKLIQEDKSEDQESDIDQSPSSITRTDSRPSSERSERSLRSLDLEHESSESEKSPSFKKKEIQQECVEDEISEPSRKSVGRIGKVLNIDDLLGITDEMPDDELTPVASPRRTPVELQEESQRDSETPKVDETPWEDETPRDIETPILETPQSDETPRDDFDIHHFGFVNALADFEIGDRVSVTGPNGTRNVGTLLFKGNVQFAPGIWAGVELDRPVGRHDGIENDTRYFRCRPNHGVLVPGHDLMPVSSEEERQPFADVRSSIESGTSSQDGEDLIKLITEADQNVQLFDESPLVSPRIPQNNKHRNETLADKITDHILESVVKDNFSKISEIADRRAGKKAPPPVAPKPKSRQTEAEAPLVNGNIDDIEEFLQSPSHETKEFKGTANIEVNNLMNDAIDHILAIRSNRMEQDRDQSRDSGNYDDNEQGPTSPTEELEGVLNKQEDVHTEGPLRPGSPIPGMQIQAVSHFN